MIITKIHAGLGNQLFQFAASRALSFHLNTTLKFDLSYYDKIEHKNAYRLNRFNLVSDRANYEEFNKLRNSKNIPRIFRIFKRLGIRITTYYKNSHIIENEILNLYNKSTNSADYYIEGWLADEIYFKGFRNIILSDLNADFLLNEEDLCIKSEIENSNSVAVHIRRGDYLSNTFFKTLPVEYYTKAFKLISLEINNPKFFFFSNDIEWTKDNFKNVPNSKFIEKNSIPDTSSSTSGDIADLMLMRSCKHQIIANSTFSWWGAWLNENPDKKVLYPALWYQDIKAQSHFESNSFIPSNWIQIKF